MSPEMSTRIEERRKAFYLAVKNHSPKLYEAAVRVGHMAMQDFGGTDEVKRAATVEACAMDLIVQAAGIDVPIDRGSAR